MRVSIHAPVQGATRPRVAMRGTFSFQSTRPCRARRDIDPIIRPNGPVSIHAPVQGATPVVNQSLTAVMFQSTRPCRARLRAGAVSAQLRGFNPRARAGRDALKQRNSVIQLVSIHAPVQGATHDRQNG